MVANDPFMRAQRRFREHQAYLLIFVEPVTCMVVGAGIYSDPHPTMTLSRSSAVLRVARGVDFDMAKDLLMDCLGGPDLDWVIDLLPEQQRAEVRERIGR